MRAAPSGTRPREVFRRPHTADGWPRHCSGRAFESKRRSWHPLRGKKSSQSKRNWKVAQGAAIVVLTGAGISAESGLATFRGAGGLWENHRVEDVASPEGFARDLKLVHRFYNLRRKRLQTVSPNPAHAALARLEAEHRGTVMVVTQNIDDLHERAGSGNVLHMHGEILKARCRACGGVFPWAGDLSEDVLCPACHVRPALRPHVVWFGEMPLGLEAIERALIAADLFVSIGTSGNVYPAAGFVAEVRALGKAHTVELNLEPSQGSRFFAERHYGRASEIVPAFVEKVLNGA
ncbi:MAG TPA: Sir2 family NAD+-dependent deacetylase [Sphingomonadales bacterium]|nr:Sir2 family NAD+-dependent deacetylase [Sphingomonadales bacterium]